jgi:DNA-binding Lrp family transcriptional regulator
MVTSKKILLELSDPLPLAAQPFAAVAERLGISDVALLRHIRAYQKSGVIRRLGAALSHRDVGFRCNALVVWKVPASKLVTTGRMLSSYPEVSHCYARTTTSEWPYNLYTMVHVRTKKDCWALIDAMAARSGIKVKKALFTLKEFKKTKTDLRGIFE